MSNSNVTLNKDLQPSTTRHFYASRPKKDNEIPYVFETVADRNTWLDKHDGAKTIKATDAYKLLRKSRNAIVAANRTNRVYVVDDINEIDTSKGHRLILSS